MQLHTWTRVEAHGRSVEPRRDHALGCLGRFVLAAGGVAVRATGHARQLHDCVVFDPAARAWDLLDDSCWCAGAGGGTPPARHGSTPGSRPGSPPPGSARQLSLADGGGAGAGTCLFDGSCLLLLRADAQGRLAALQRVELRLPEEMEQRQAEQEQRGTEVLELAILEQQAEVGPTSIRLGWVPPTKNADKLVRCAAGRWRRGRQGGTTGC